MLPDRRQRLEALGFVWNPFDLQWEEGFAHLHRFHQREGHSHVPGNHREQGYRLGGWVSHQRKDEDTMPPDRRRRLDAFGFVWDPIAAQWKESVQCLASFRQREGHCRVPDTHREQGLRLGQWVADQRKNEDTMPPDRRQRLEALGFVWDVLTTQWEEGIHFLEIFRQREGHCRVPQNHREQKYRLGQWVSNQRQDKDTMPPERRQRLDALGFMWNKFDAQWEEGFRCLESLYQREGHCRVPQNHRELGSRLGLWVAVQRRSRNTMSPERRQRLDALGFVWDVLTAQWEEGFNALQAFHQRNGHCRVRVNHREAEYPLGLWVSHQRQDRDALPPDRRQRLDAIGFVWDPLCARWEEGFRYLTVYRQREGHCLVSAVYREHDYRLGQWVMVQRQTKETMSPERHQRLDALGFVWKVR